MIKAKDFNLKVVNEIEENEFELLDFKPYMEYKDFVGRILADAEILRPTGIVDINGLMIYENYIIDVKDTDMLGNTENYKCIVTYNESKARFEATELRADVKYIHTMEILNGLCKLKVIGNIYQNKELLKSN